MNEKTESPNPRKAKASKVFEWRTLLTSIVIAIITVGLFSLSPINVLSANTPEITTAESQFNLDTAYAYVGRGAPNDTVTDSRGTLLSPVSQYPSAVYFNITRPAAENLACDALIEVYNITIASDKGPAEYFVFFAGTNNDPSFSDADLNKLTEGIYDLFDLNSFDGVTGNFRFNWTNDESVLSAKVGSYGIYTNYINGLGLWSAGKPNMVSVTFHRLGYVTMTSGVISVQPDTINVNNKTQVQLQEFDDGFLKNTIGEITQANRFQPIT
ncbi:MAG: hypothetical protein ACBZ72_01605 [Candidatus Bathyarchaeia archaeon]|jgi:hypothetical protein